MSDAVGVVNETDLNALGRTYFSVWSKDARFIETEISLTGVPTDDPEKNQKAGIFAVQWLDRNGMEIEVPVRGYTRSPKYGTFRYLEFSEPSGGVQFTIPVKTPPYAYIFVARVWKFSNASLALEAISTRRAR